MMPAQREDKAMSKNDQSDPNHRTADPAALPAAPPLASPRSWHGSVNGHAQAVVIMGRNRPRPDAPATLDR